MARNVTVGLIQCATPFDPAWSVEKIQKAALDKQEADKRRKAF